MSESAALLEAVSLAWNSATLVYFLVANGTYLAVTVLSAMAVSAHLRWRHFPEDKMLLRSSQVVPPVTILAPAYNEQLTVVENVRGLLSLEFPVFEVILVNDGSKDETLQTLLTAFQMEPVPRAQLTTLPTKPIRQIYRCTTHPNLTVVDKENGGKADALNAGLNFSRHPLVTAIDTDSLLEPDVLLKLVRPFLARPETIAVGGVVKVVNSSRVENGRVTEVRVPRSRLARFQVVEYARAFLFGRVGWHALNMLTIISGAFGMFSRSVLVEAGGYRHTVGEDMELVLRLHSRMREQGQRYHIGFTPDPVCWTEVPESLRALGRQRNRWSRGLLESIWIHRRMLLNPRYGRMGLFALPFALVIEGLGPVIEILGLAVFVASWWIGYVDLTFGILFMLVAVVLGIVQSVLALSLDVVLLGRHRGVLQVARLLGIAFIDNLGYRQLNLWWRLQGMVDFLRGKREWGVITRKGFDKS